MKPNSKAIQAQYTAKYFQPMEFNALGLTLVEKNPANFPKNCCAAIPRERTLYGQSSTR